MDHHAKREKTITQTNVTAEIIVTYGPGALANPEAMAAFDFALSIWSEEIVSSVPIRISAEFADLGTGVLASAGPTTLISNFPNAPEQDVFYPVALANSLAGEDLAPDVEFDLVVNLGNGIPWYFGTDGNTPAGLYDFVTVALHEAAHGLGFVDGGNVSGTTGSINNGGNPFIFDTFLVDGENNSVLDLPNPSVELGDFFTSGDVFVNGEFAVAALNGENPEIYAPNPFQGGSSIAHWDETAFPAGDPNSLMSPQVGSSESIFDIGDITRGFFRDMGWVLAEQAPITVIPNQIIEELNIEETITQEITVTNTSEAPVTVTISASENSVLISSLSTTGFTLVAGEATTFTAELSTVGISKGIYEESINLTIEGFDDVLSIPLNVRVLDGTEAPIIVVAPTSFDETVQQLQIITRDLLIQNTGDDILTYSVTVDDLPQSTTSSRALKTSNFILENGFTTKTANTRTSGTISKEAHLLTKNNNLNNLVTSLYSTDFEDFTIGDLDGQLGWASYFATWEVSDLNPSGGEKAIRLQGDGSFSTALAFSPTITPGSEPFMVATADINIEGSGVTWEFIPQSTIEGFVNTRVRFNTDTTIDIFDADVGTFTRINTTTPSGYFNIRVIVDKDDLAMSIFFDDDLIYSGRAAAGQIDQVVLLSSMEGTESIMDVDNVEIIDGDENASFISVAPIAGTVNFGTETTLEVKFDARTLDVGQYNATINIVSNDSTNESIDIPVTLTVVTPPTISVTSTSLSTAIDVQIDDPATKTETFTVTNTGEAPLEFTAGIGRIVFTPPASNSRLSVSDLDLSKYANPDSNNRELKLASKFGKSGISSSKLKNIAFENSTNFIDSIHYDSGINFPDDFIGFNDGVTPLTAAVKFDVESDFTLTAVRNAYRTETSIDPIILEIYEGGATPAEGTLLLTQVLTQTSTDGIFALEILDEAFDFSAGDSFWIVHKYSGEIAFSQGVDDGATIRPDTYYGSGDGGASYFSVDYVFLTRALSGQDNDYVTLEPSEGSVAPGESVEVAVTFDATNLANGNYTTDINITSNDPVTPTTAVTTSLDVTGQTSFIELSDQFILFNNVFIGDVLEKTFTINNSGLAQINVSSITSDNGDFTITPVTTAIPAGESVEVSVTFTPSTVGNINGIITIESDASNATTSLVIVNGVGIDPPIAVLDPLNVSETVDAGNTVDTQITLKNEGTYPLLYSFPDLAVAAALAQPDVKLNDTRILEFSSEISNEKGTKDTRVGSKVLYSIGTDNGFGYTWIDSDEDGGPIYNFIDISNTGTDITTDLGGDGDLSVSLEFPFEFYGTQYDTAYINANGYITFNESSFFTYINDQIPVDDGVNNMIAGLWTDLEPQNFDGSVHYQSFDDSFVVQWTNATLYFGSEEETVTFQIVLYPDGNIDVFYEDVETASFLISATVGIENEDATDGAQVVFNSTYIKNQLALRFVKPEFALTPFISNTTPISGVVPAGGSTDLLVTLDATDLNDGVYYDELVVSSNSPDKSKSTSLIELTVNGFPEITVSSDAIVFEPIFVGLQSTTDLLIENTGSKALEIDLSNQNTDFTITTDTTNPILPGGSLLVTIDFAPTSVGLIEDVLIIESNDAFGNESLSIPLSGIGVDPPVINVIPEEFNITLEREKSTTEIITIENTGGSVLNYSLVSTPLTTSLTSNATVKGYEKIKYEEKIISKDQADNRVGPKFVNASGGPGTFGYIWTDNNSGGPEYDFIDISITGTLASVDADGDETVELPFTFNFFGEDQNSVIIAANGFLTFSPITAFFGAYVNQQIPSTANPNFLIAGMWDDIEPQDGVGVFYQAFDDYFVVQYEEVPGYGTFPVKDPVTFQIILFEDGSIKMQYKNVNSEIRTSSTVGLEGPMGETGLQVIFNTEYLTDGLAITFTPPIMGSVEAGASVEIPMDFSAVGLEANTTYYSDIIITSNDIVTPEVIVPVTLNVLDAPEIASFTLINAETNEEIGPLNEGDIIDLNDYEGINSFSIVANSGVIEIESVVFDFNDQIPFRTENYAPYALNGDSNGNYRDFAFPLGVNTITATPFSENGGQGEAGIPLTISFEVIDSNPPTVTDFLLVDARNNTIVGPLNEGDIIDLADYRRNSFSVIANTTGSLVESVVFDLNDEIGFYTDNRDVYTLNGDSTRRGRTTYDGIAFLEGINIITATAFRENDGEADSGDSLTVTFEVVDSSSTTGSLVGQISPNPVDNVVTISFEESDDETFKLIPSMNLKASIHTMAGYETLQPVNFTLDNEKKGQVDIGSLSQGVYILRVLDQQNKVISQIKMIKK